MPFSKESDLQIVTADKPLLELLITKSFVHYLLMNTNVSKLDRALVYQKIFKFTMVSNWVVLFQQILFISTCIYGQIYCELGCYIDNMLMGILC